MPSRRRKFSFPQIRQRCWLPFPPTWICWSGFCGFDARSWLIWLGPCEVRLSERGWWLQCLSTGFFWRSIGFWRYWICKSYGSFEFRESFTFGKKILPDFTNYIDFEKKKFGYISFLGLKFWHRSLKKAWPINKVVNVKAIAAGMWVVSRTILFVGRCWSW